MKRVRFFVSVLVLTALALPAFASSKRVTLPGGETMEIWAPGADGVGTPKPAGTIPEQALGLTGLTEPLEVRVAVVVKADGSVAAIESFDRAPTAALQAARVTLGEWAWKPAKRRGKPVDAYAIWTLRFEPQPIAASRPGALQDSWHDRQVASLTGLGPTDRSAIAAAFTGPSALTGPSAPTPSVHGGFDGVVYPRFPQISSSWINYNQSSNLVRAQPSPYDRH